jgi:hypothetical protein
LSIRRQLLALCVIYVRYQNDQKLVSARVHNGQMASNRLKLSWLRITLSTVRTGTLKAKNLVEFLKPFAGPKGGAGAEAGKPAGKTDITGSSKGGSGGTSKPFADQDAAGGAKAGTPEAARRKQEAEEVQDPVSAVVDLTADDLAAVLEGDDAWLFGVFDGEWSPLGG